MRLFTVFADYLLPGRLRFKRHASTVSAIIPPSGESKQGCSRPECTGAPLYYFFSVCLTKNRPEPLNDGRLASWIKWRACGVREAKEGLVNELWMWPQTQVNLDIPIEIMKGIQVRWPRRPCNRASPSNPATRKYSWIGHRISCQNISCLWYYSKHIMDICQGAAESCTSMSFLHWGWWPSIWATVIRRKMVR